MSGVYCIACKSRYDTLERYMFHRFPKDVERCKEWALLSHCPNLAYMEPGAFYRTYRLCSAHFNPSQYMGKCLINNAKPSIFNWSDSSKIDTKSNIVFDPEEIKTLSSQIKEYTNIMNNPKRFKKFDESNIYSSFITEPNTFYDNQQPLFKQFFIKTEMENINNIDIKVENLTHLIDHNYYVSPVTYTINIYDKSRINGHLLDHNYFSQVSDTNIHWDKKRNNQHLLEHNYFLPVFNFKIIREILHSDDTSKEEDLNVHTYEKPVSYSILPGVRLNSQVYMDNLNYRYYKHSSRNHVINPEGAKNYSLSQSQLCVRRMRQRRKVSSII
ncbi:uncharacterized protein LOC111037107 isoform X2 [Myzus persicae]|uniref:uncharacterized protein LOC111037107 isoform X2 n=1 Tax=Myzus persicae TaxID=13164 RepID=UPI000B9316D6|nr:uncharacterized protein LOC111037107 isoform X2 [Myzus persicae]